MRSISQRELRNESGEVMRQVAAGVSFRVTSRGEPIAILAPLEPRHDLTLREGTQEMIFPPGVHSDITTEEALAELRGQR